MLMNTKVLLLLIIFLFPVVGQFSQLHSSLSSLYSTSERERNISIDFQTSLIHCNAHKVCGTHDIMESFLNTGFPLCRQNLAENLLLQ